MVFRPLSALVFAAVVLQLGACSFNRAPNRAPVEDRGGQRVDRQAPGAENAGKPGYYTVKSGDTLNRIALETGQSPRDIARWSALGNPNVLEVGQVLRVTPPAPDATVATSRPIAPPSVLSPSATPPLAGASSAAGVPPVATTSPETPAAASNDDDVPWLWPSSGNVIASFDEVKNKGLDFAGAAGDPVLAAADGRVVYAGAGLRGYGNLVILKHNNTYLTAYAHNQTLLVKEDQTVRRGQKIAEMGNSDADRVKLHFEVRRQGKPVDPAKYLPGR
ncbi:MAG: peptidoglycan DD-metalloendopeptidase family protein [Pseudomonadota bacterium]